MNTAEDSSSSAPLIEQYRQMHAEGHFKGYSIKPHVERIKQLIKFYQAKSMLDYGSGKGLFHVKHQWGIPVRCYDPAVERFSRKPSGRFDIVICTDVLEHIHEADIETVLAEIDDYSRKCIFLSICTRKARKLLPDGRNCHLTVRPEEWWLDMVDEYMGISAYTKFT